MANKAYIVGGDNIYVDDELHNSVINPLAHRMIKLLGFEVSEDLDLSTSRSFRGQQAYTMALTAYKFHLDCGLD